MDWDVADPLQAFQEFWALAEFWLEDQHVNKEDQYHKIVYLLAPKGIETCKSSTWEDPTNKEDLAKVWQVQKQFPNPKHIIELQRIGM